MTRKIIASMLSGAIDPAASTEKSTLADNVQPHPASLAPRKRSPLAQGGSIGGNSAVGAINKALETVLSAQGDVNELRAQLASGQAIVELDPDVIEGSFVRDRMDGSDAAHESLVDAIRARGQQVPILVRPHPSKPGHYQVAYGHRRLRAVTQLGIKVRAVVKEMSDDELVVAQGQENNARLDLTFIEQAMFAFRLEQRGFSRSTITEALSIDKSNLAKLISVPNKIPHGVINAIGHAPGIGRGRWLELTDLFQVPSNVERAQSTIGLDQFKAAESADRFQILLTDLTEAAASRGQNDETGSAAIIQNGPNLPLAASKPVPTFWNDHAGRKLARIVKDHKSFTLKVDQKLAPDFGDYLVSKLDELYASFQSKSQQADS
ncbi:plasmid partitioning protein RepB [Microvirga calopogonii]|uniref:plasmid partitioning protein RepB n=1 Tax=Microvirga calopogonii TaxID=2078013 RepID=UPI000E0CBF6C|nr:plasmid partitioning protein RepB [Microvirga calopogonii]